MFSALESSIEVPSRVEDQQTFDVINVVVLDASDCGTHPFLLAVPGKHRRHRESSCRPVQAIVCEVDFVRFAIDSFASEDEVLRRRAGANQRDCGFVITTEGEDVYLVADLRRKLVDEVAVLLRVHCVRVAEKLRRRHRAWHSDPDGAW